MLWKKVNSVLTKKKCSEWLDTLHMKVFGCADYNGTGFGAIHSDGLRYGLHVCIILEAAHHRTTFRIFCNVTQKTTLKENSHKMFHISSLIVLFFLWEGQGCF